MPVIVRGVEIINDPWFFTQDSFDNYDQHPWFSIVPLESLKDKTQWPLSQTWIGAWFDLEVDMSDLDSSILSLPLLNIFVNSYTDGRVFSLAQQLKTVLGFTGELRVSGNFLLDQMAHLRGCGVDSFFLPEDSDIDHALFIISQTPTRAF